MRGCVNKMEFINEKRKFKNLGIMVDCSRNAVPTVGTLKKFVDIMAKMGYTFLELYTEDTYEIKGEPYFGYLRGRYKAEELKEVDAYCASKGIELIPCIQTLAHLYELTRYDVYQELFDVNDVLLADSDKTYEFIDKMFRTVSECFSSRKINIGMDEAYMLGRGRYIDKFGYKDKKEIMLKHLSKVIEIAEKYSFKCEMWGDMFSHMKIDGNDISTQYKEVLNKVKLLFWHYEDADCNFYNKNLNQLKTISEDIGFAGGAMKWIGIAPANEYSMRVIKKQCEVCYESNVDTFLITAWADFGGEASLFSILPTMYYTALCAYGCDLNNFDKSYFKELTGVSFDDFMLVDLPNYPVPKQYTYRNNKSFMFLYNDLLLGVYDKIVSDGIEDYFKIAAEKLKTVESNEYDYIFNTLSSLCNILSLKAEFGKKVQKAYAANDKKALALLKDKLVKLVSEIDIFYKNVKIQWDKENKSFGFEIQCVKIGALKQRTIYVIEKINDFLENKINDIEELDAEKLEVGWPNYGHPIDEDTNCWHIWQNSITTGNI